MSIDMLIIYKMGQVCLSEGIRGYPVLNKRVLIESRMRITGLTTTTTPLFPICWIQ